MLAHTFIYNRFINNNYDHCLKCINNKVQIIYNYIFLI